MLEDKNKRQRLLGKLSRNLLITTTPLMAAFASYGAAASDEAAVSTGYVVAQAEASSEAKGEAEAKAEPEAKGEAEAQGEAEATGEAEAQGEGEAKGEAEAQGEAEGDRKLVLRPMFSKRFKGDQAALEARGAELFNDASLSTNGLMCSSCHTDFAGYNDTFKKPYKHFVQMGKDMFGLNKISAETMVQICMVAPMEAKPLAWDSEELAALSTYVVALQKEFATR